jgi:hypothetical protein
VAIAVAWQTVVTNITTSAALYTTPTSTAPTFAYARDLVVTNSGASGLYVAIGTAASLGVATASTYIPSGGTLLLTQCQVPNSTIIFGFSSGTAAASIGFATNVSYI